MATTDNLRHMAKTTFQIPKDTCTQCAVGDELKIVGEDEQTWTVELEKGDETETEVAPTAAAAPAAGGPKRAPAVAKLLE